MSVNLTFYKSRLLSQFLEDTAQARKKLLEELVVNASDPIIFKRRFHMLKQLSHYESQIIEKIYNFDSDNPDDFDIKFFHLNNIIDRSS